jgi:hypothetical protein
MVMVMVMVAVAAVPVPSAQQFYTCTRCCSGPGP